MIASSHVCVPESELAQFVNGALDTEHLQQIAAHVDSCESCQDTVVALAEHSDTFVDAVRAAGSGAPEPQEGALKLGLKRMLTTFRAGISNVKSRADSSSSPLETADVARLGPYVVLEQLGAGGMGHVYRATHTKLKRNVALKVLPANRWANTAAVSRFEREMEAIGQLDHANIVRASDAGEDQGMHYLVMEYVDGLDLSRLVNRLGPLPVAEACEMIRQAAIGLHYAHENGLVHRDIKPSNLMLARGRSHGLMLDDKPTLKILDLGLALLRDEHLREGHELTTVGTLMGTLDYMSPEQGIDSHAVDQRTDIYGLGATLFKLLTGRAPYADPQYDTLMRKMTALATKPAPSIASLRADLPEQLASIVDRMLLRDPDARFEYAKDVAEALAPHASDADLAKLLRRGLSKHDPDDKVTPRVPVTAFACDTGTVPVMAHKSTRGRNKENWIWPLLIAAGFLAAVGGIIFHFATDYGDVVIRSDDPNAHVVVKRGGKQIDELRIENGEKLLRLRTGNYEIEVTGDADVSVTPSQVELTRGGRALVNLKRLQAARISDLQAAHRRLEEFATQLKTAPRTDVIHRDSRLLIQVVGTTPERPIAGIFRLESSGNVHLGPGYGRVKIEGMTYQEAEKAIKSQLEKQLNVVEVMVTVPHSEMLLEGPTQGLSLDSSQQAKDLRWPREPNPETERKLLGASDEPTGKTEY